MPGLPPGLLCSSETKTSSVALSGLSSKYKLCSQFNTFGLINGLLLFTPKPDLIEFFTDLVKVICQRKYIRE